jgi:hypothetical protein
MMDTAIRKLVLYLFAGGLVYHSVWMWGAGALQARHLSGAWHVGLLYIIPLLLAVGMAWMTGVFKVDRSLLVRWLLVVLLGVAVPLIALQLVGAVACLISSECL